MQGFPKLGPRITVFQDDCTGICWDMSKTKLILQAIEIVNLGC